MHLSAEPNAQTGKKETKHETQSHSRSILFSSLKFVIQDMCVSDSLVSKYGSPELTTCSRP